MGAPLRVGLYARVSTHDQQTLALQVEALRTYAAQRGWSVVTEVTEIGSGAVQRPQREQLMQAARRRAIDAVLVWRLDRWGGRWRTSCGPSESLRHWGSGSCPSWRHSI
jgi:putative DNA-invertase from lambdoid prophage Rac